MPQDQMLLSMYRCLKTKCYHEIFQKFGDFLVDRSSELDRVELDIQIGQASLGFEGYFFGGQDTLKRGRSRIIAFDKFFVHMFFRDQFQNGWKKLAYKRRSA